MLWSKGRKRRKIGKIFRMEGNVEEGEKMSKKN